MESEQMLNAFRDLIRDSKGPVLVKFQRNRFKDDVRGASPFIEILEPGLSGKLRQFELDLGKSGKIIEHFNLPADVETAVIFENGATHKKFHGFKNVRKYLRAMGNRN